MTVVYDANGHWREERPTTAQWVLARAGFSARELSWPASLTDQDRAWLRKHLALADGRWP